MLKRQPRLRSGQFLAMSVSLLACSLDPTLLAGSISVCFGLLGLIAELLAGFYDDCKRRYSIRLWKTFGSLFNHLPPAAVVQDKILCVHGGLSPGETGEDRCGLAGVTSRLVQTCAGSTSYEPSSCQQT